MTLNRENTVQMLFFRDFLRFLLSKIFHQKYEIAFELNFIPIAKYLATGGYFFRIDNQKSLHQLQHSYATSFNFRGQRNLARGTKIDHF